MKLVDKLKNEIRNKGSVSFAQIEEFFEKENFDYRGDIAQILDPLGDTYIWAGWNDSAWAIVDKIIDHKFYGYVPCSPSNYLIRGTYSKDPIACENKKYKRTHWLPVLIAYNKKPKK